MWQIETTSRATQGSAFSLALDGNDRAHFSYFDGGLDSYRWDGAGWQLEIVDRFGPVGIDSDMAVDDEAGVHFSYRDLRNGDLKYAYWDGVKWQIEVVENQPYNYYSDTSLTLDSQRYPHISYQNGYLQHAWWDGVGWQTETVDNNYFTGDANSLVSDSTGRLHISYHDGYNFDLKYGWWDGFDWQLETVDSKGEVGRDNSLATDSKGKPHISYRYWNNVDFRVDLRHAWWDGVGWQIETVDVGHGSSIALDSQDRVHISYLDGSSGTLKYAYGNGVKWQIESVPGEGLPITGYTSLALDSQDGVHISYSVLDNYEYFLRYASWDGVGWQTENMGGEIGTESSLAIDRHDNVMIGYFDGRYNQLKVARSGVSDFIEVEAGGQLVVPGYATITVPAGAFTNPVILTYTALGPGEAAADVGMFFEVSAVYADTHQPAQLDLDQTIKIIAQYKDYRIPFHLHESTLQLYHWQLDLQFSGFIQPTAPDSWQLEPASILDPIVNTVTADVTSLGVFAILGDYHLIYLPQFK